MMRGLSDRRAILIAVDSTVAFAAVFVGVVLRFGGSGFSIWRSELELPPVWLIALLFAVLTFTSFATAGVYRREIYWDLRTEIKDLLKGIVLLAFVSLAFLFLFKLEDVSRIAIAIAFGALSVGSIASRLVLRSMSRRAALAGKALRNWLVVGPNDRVAALVDLLHTHPHVGAGIVGVVAESASDGTKPKWLGTIYDLPEILRAHVIDEVVVSGESDPKRLEAILSVCAEQGITVRLAMDSVAPTALRGRMEEYGGIPMWSVLATPEHRMGLAVKRIIDFVGASVLLVILSPLFLATSLAVLVSDGRPVLYRQGRGGHHGRPFKMLKFRTMVDGAEDMRADLVGQNERVGPVFKIKDDPRITKLGQWLRRTSLDEAPQLINVVTGHMSLVGPRPQPLEEVAEYDLWHRRRLSMRPGITGLWQIKARDDSSFDTWMDFDLEYIDRWSLWLDLSILLQTPAAIYRNPGV